MGLWICAPERGGPANVSDFVLTSQDYINFENVRNWLLSSSLAKFTQFYPESFFEFFCRLFLPDYKVRRQLLHLGTVCSTELFGQC